jgi:hypothetical protein
MEIGEDAPVFVKTAPLEESFAIAMYEVIAPPPMFVGAVKVVETEVPPIVAVPIVGASGVFNGIYDAVNMAA